MTVMNFGVFIGLGMLAVIMIAIAYRMLSAKIDADRAISADLLMFSFVGMLAFLGALMVGEYFSDLVLIASVVGFISSVSLARALTRGRR